MGRAAATGLGYVRQSQPPIQTLTLALCHPWTQSSYERQQIRSWRGTRMLRLGSTCLGLGEHAGDDFVPSVGSWTS